MITKLERKLKKEHLFTGLTSVEGFISKSQSLGFLGLLGKNLALSTDFFSPITCLWSLFNIKFLITLCLAALILLLLGELSSKVSGEILF